MSYVLLFSVFVIATCGLVYELIAGALASYLLGDSVTQFSTVIGVYLFSMGIGSYLSKFINRNLMSVFIQVELLVGMVGGCSAAILFLSFEHVASFRILLYSLVVLTGTLVGFEIPILMRILQNQFDFKDLVSKVFTFDYIGALLASLVFPLVLVPHLGLVRSAFLFGIFNVAVAIWALFLFSDHIKWIKSMKMTSFAVFAFLIAGFVLSDRILGFAETASYSDPVVYTKSTPYQRIVVTQTPGDVRLFLNGNLQFSSRDEYRYHEALVHMGMGSLAAPRTALILGGGDGLAAREILKYPSIEKVVLVDLDPAMTQLFSSQEGLRRLNEDALLSPKMHVVNRDAFMWLRENQEQFDFIAVDFPDPSNFTVGKLYTNTFYRQLRTALAPNGVGVVQSTSPYVAKKTFWTIDNTLRSVGFRTLPYHVYVPAFGDWGYILFGNVAPTLPTKMPEGLKYMNLDIARTLVEFPADMKVAVTDVNKLNNQILVRYFEQEWAEYAH
ncbi:MAG: polyamine aminopropyltransferase [Bdellovibrionaceae bacterium]|nr:polyamine aminopropyltransferase [Pseudobdellovibrionaceae bacterium]